MQRRLVILFLLTLLAVSAAHSLAQDAPAQIRVANFSPDSPVLEVYIDGQPSGIQTLKFNDVSGWVQIPAGEREITFVQAGLGLDATVVGPMVFDLPSGSWSTIPVLGLYSSNRIYGALLVEDYPSPIPAGNARITVFNGIPGLTGMSVLNNADGTVLAENLSFGQAANFDLPAGPQDLGIQVGTASLATGPINLRENVYYLFGLIRRQNGAGFAFRAISEQAVSSLLAGQAELTPEPASVIQLPAPPVNRGQAQAPRESFELDSAFEGTPTVLDILTNTQGISVTGRAFVGTGLGGALQRGTFTIFAPDNRAWNSFVREYPDVLGDSEAIQHVLLYHIVNDMVMRDYIFDQMTLHTVQGPEINFTTDSWGVTINNRARILAPDLIASNGVVHAIDHVLVPPDMLEGSEDSTDSEDS